MHLENDRKRGEDESGNEENVNDERRERMERELMGRSCEGTIKLFRFPWHVFPVCFLVDRKWEKV